MTDLTISMLAIVGVLFGGVVICTQPRARMPSIVMIGVLLITVASSWAVDENSSLSVVARVLGAAAFALAAVVGSRAGAGTRMKRWGLAFLVPIAMFITFATLPHGQIQDFVAYGIGLLTLAVMIISLPRVPLDDLRSGARAALLIIMISSLVAGALIPGEALEGGRLRGIFENANSLGFFAFLAIAAALFLRGRRFWTITLMASGVVALVLTGSRASLLAVLICLAGWVVSRLIWVGWALLITGLAFGDRAVGWASSLSPELELLLRNNNSRDGSVQTALADWSSSPLFGVGLGQESGIIASTPLRALAQGGSLGFAAIVLLWTVLLVMALRSSPSLTWFTLAAIAHSLFEGWMLSPISPLLMVFVVLWWSLYGGGRLAPNVEADFQGGTRPKSSRRSRYPMRA